MDRVMERVKELSKLEKLIGIVIVVLPYIYSGKFGVLYYTAGMAMLLLQGVEIFKYDEIRNEEARYSTLKIVLATLFAYIWMGVFSFTTLFKPIEYNNFVILPDITFLLYLILPLTYYIFSYRKRVRGEKDRRVCKCALLMLIPIIISNISYASYISGNMAVDKSFILYDIYQAVFIAAICEELFFRFFLYNVYKEKFNVRSAQIITALIFTLWHFNLIRIIAMNTEQVLFNLLAIFLLGFFNSIIYEKSRNIVLPIVVHAVVNGVVKNIVVLILTLSV